ncbi:MATE family efflux transporter [uncultured Cetobacterium sp.]|uniref:MATE family efflux transporter n=2 Tax=uncultured Cetobacterium sp. TaxID=527638 RepID=UPI002624568A|nr:MATE family efflux transporter [uncultured Cetobacterium sp.]
MDVNRLGTEKISKLLWEYSIPAITGTLVYILYNIVDRIFISFGLGRLAIAGMSITLPIFTFILAISLFIGVGSGVLISINIGAKKVDVAERVLGVSMLLFIGVGFIFSVLGTKYLNEILKLFGATKENIIYAKDYMKVIFIAAPFQFLSIGLNNIIRGEGSPKVAMKMNIIGAIINIVLDPILIFTLHLGIKGAAIATIVANVVVAFFQLKHFLVGNSKIKLKKENIVLDLDIIKKISKVGISPFTMQLSNSIVVIFINKSLNIYGGDIAIAAYGIINSITVLLYMPIVGINQGSQPILGYNYGAEKFHRVRETYIKSIGIAFLITIVGFILIMFFPSLLVDPFIKNDLELKLLTIKAIRIMFSMVFLLGINTIGSSYFQSIGRAKITAGINIFKQLILMLSFIYILPKKEGLLGIWESVPLSEGITFLVVIFFVMRELKYLKGVSKYVD